MVEPPVDPSMWSLDIPSGGVVSGEASMFEFDQGEPDELVRRSIAVVTGEVVEIGSPATPSIGAGSEFPSDMSVDQFFGGQVMVPVRVRIDEVVAGAGVEPGTEYELQVGAVVDDGELLEFAEDRLPVLGERYLLFLRATGVDDVPVRSGRLRTTGVGTGRIPLAEAEARGMLRPERWADTIGADLGSDLREEEPDAAEPSDSGGSTASTDPVPPPSPGSAADAAMAFDIDRGDVDRVDVTATGLVSPSVEVGGFWLIERRQDEQWILFARIGDSPSTSGTIEMCLETEGAEACAQSLESVQLEPGQFSFRRNVEVGSRPPGAYRVRLDNSTNSVSDHLLVDRDGVSTAERGT